MLIMFLLAHFVTNKFKVCLWPKITIRLKN